MKSTEICELRDELIDALLAFSLLTRQIAQNIAGLNKNVMHEKGEENVEDNRPEHAACRIVRTDTIASGYRPVHP